MSVEQQMIYQDKSFRILGAKQELIVHPSAFGMVPINKASLQVPFFSEFHIEEYRLILDKLQVFHADHVSAISYKEETSVKGTKIIYNGTILVGSNVVKEYYIKDKLACFSYQYVYEFVFDQGVLITTIDQSKAMLKIRKNIDMGLRNLSKGRDIRCIKRFLNAALIGDYNTFSLPGRRMKYIKDMQGNYE